MIDTLAPQKIFCPELSPPTFFFYIDEPDVTPIMYFFLTCFDILHVACLTFDMVDSYGHLLYFRHFIFLTFGVVDIY